MELLESGERSWPEVVVRRKGRGPFSGGGRRVAMILCKEEIVVVQGSTKLRDGMPGKDFTRALIILKGGESGGVIMILCLGSCSLGRLLYGSLA